MRALALDGGGIRGYISVLILEDIERRLAARDNVDLDTRVSSYLIEKFDLFAGTSTGAILAAAIARGMKLSAIRTLYEELGPAIFDAGFGQFLRRFKRLSGLGYPKYDDEKLGRFLRQQFARPDGGDLRMHEIEKRLCIQVYDASLNEPVVFKSHGHSDRNQGNASLPVWEVVKASASAPTFFPAHVMYCHKQQALSRSWYSSVVGAAESAEGARNAMIDGGVYAANPAAIALAELSVLARENGRDLDDLGIVSVGTGENPAESISAKQGRTLGRLGWLKPLVNIFMTGVSKHTHNLVSRVGAERYARFEVILGDRMPMDTGAREDFRRMQSIVAAYLDDYPSDADSRSRHAREGYLYSEQNQKTLAMI